MKVPQPWHTLKCKRLANAGDPRKALRSAWRPKSLEDEPTHLHKKAAGKRDGNNARAARAAISPFPWNPKPKPKTQNPKSKTQNPKPKFQMNPNLNFTVKTAQWHTRRSHPGENVSNWNFCELWGKTGAREEIFGWGRVPCVVRICMRV